MLFGKPTKLVRHVDEDTITLEPQRFYVHRFWKYHQSATTTRTDGLDLQDEKLAPLGSKVTKHKVEILVTPETIEPQQLYIGRLKTSFGDIFNPTLSGMTPGQASYQDTATDENYATSNAITPHLYPDKTAASSGHIVIGGDESTNQEIGGSGSGYGISEWMLDDNIKHFINLKKVTVFDQRPLMGERWQRIPSKVKRINQGTGYFMIFFNDSPRGATPSDTQVKINIKSYWEEKAI